MSAPHRIVILGGGTGGTLVANRLHRHYEADAHITVVDVDDRHVYQPGFIFVPFGLAEPERLVRSRSGQLRPGIHFVLGAVDRVETAENRVLLEDGVTLDYDVLVIASGVRLLPEETEGLTGPGWNERSFTFYTLEGATMLGEALRGFDGGRFVVNVVDMPIKCPVAPLELAFLADWYFTDRGIRDDVDIVFATPLDGAFTKPVASKALGSLLEEKDIRLETEFAAGQVDGAAGLLKSWDEREIPFDILACVPLHGGDMDA